MLEVYANRIASTAWQRHLLFLAATMATVLFVGYHFGTFDQTIHIPFLKKYVNPGLYPGDPFLELRTQHYSYFWFAFQPLLRAGVLEPAMFVVHCVATYLTFWAVWALSFTLFQSPPAALLAVLTFAWPHLGFAGFPILEFSLLNRTFVLPWLLVAILLFLQERYVWAFALLGVLYNLHVISVQFVLAMFLLASVLQFREIGWRRLGQGLALFLVGASPVLLWKLGGSPVDVTPRPEWFAIIARGTLYNLFFLFPPYPHILLTSTSGLAALALFAIARRARPATRRDRTVTQFVAAALIILAVQVITAQWLPITIIIQSQIIRAGLFVLIFALIYFAWYVAEYYRARAPSRARWAALAGGLVFAALPLITLVVWFVLRLAHTPGWRRRAAAWTILAVSVAGTVAIALAYDVWRPGIHLYGPRTAWEDAQRWARDHTPAEARFITPPHIWWLYQSDWRVFSERSSVATLSELLEAAFVPEYLEYWQPRFEALAPGALEQFRGDFFENKRLTAEAYYGLSAADFERLGDRFAADYLVVERQHAYDLTLAYENSGYRIYALR
jgi:hypothetical protein